MAQTGLADSTRTSPLVWTVVGAIGLGIVTWWVVQWWRYPPAVEFDNIKYIQLLRTAVSSKRPDWVVKVRGAIQQRFESGEMSERERAHFEKILALADANSWEAADRECFRFEEAQLNRRRSLPASAAHNHDWSGTGLR